MIRRRPHVFAFIVVSSRLHVFMSSCLHVFMSSCLHVFMSSCLHVFTSSRLHVFTSSCHLTLTITSTGGGSSTPGIGVPPKRRSSLPGLVGVTSKSTI